MRDDVYAMDTGQKIIYEGGKAAIAAAAGLIPGVGKLIGSAVGMLLDALTNDPNDAWKAVEKQVEALIDQKLDDFYTNLMTNDVKLLNQACREYVMAVNRSLDTPQNKEYGRARLRQAIEQAKAVMVKTSDPKYRYALIPFYAQAVNLWLLLLRDTVSHERTLDIGATEIADARAGLAKAIRGPGVLPDPSPGGRPAVEGRSELEGTLRDAFLEGCEKGKAWSPKKQFDYQRESWLRGFEYCLMWPLLADPANPVTRIDRPAVEIFLGPYSTMSAEPELFGDRARHVPTTPEFTERIEGLRWGGRRVPLTALQLYYDPPRKGPAQEETNEFHSPRPEIWDPSRRLTKVRVFNTAEYTFGLEFLDENGVPFYAAGEPAGAGGDLCALPGWEVSQILRGPVMTLDLARAWTAVVGLRPRNSVITGPDLKTTPAANYQLVDVDSGTVLDLDAYTLTGSARAVTSVPDGNPTQRWTLEPVGPGKWTVASAYNGALLTVGTDGHAGAKPSPAEHPAVDSSRGTLARDTTRDTVWSAERADDGAWQLTADGHSAPLTVRADGTVAPAGPGERAARWSAVPVTGSTAPAESSDGPLLVASPGAHAGDGAVTTRLTVRVPSTSTTSDSVNAAMDAGTEGWRLSFWLPRETDADSLSVRGDGARLISSDPQDRGLYVTVASTDAAPSAEGAAFDLTMRLPGGADGRPVIADARLADLSIPTV